MNKYEEVITSTSGMIYMIINRIDPFTDLGYRKIGFTDAVLSLVAGYCMRPMVLFISNSSMLFLGIIEGYYIDHNCGNSFWYNVRVNSNTVYTYSNHGDIAEWDIVGKAESGLEQS